MSRSLASLAVMVVTVLLGVRLFVLIDSLAVDVLFWDQFGYYTAVWNGGSTWDLFQWQHGPHRMGLGFPIIAAIDSLTGWNQRAQAFVVGATMCVACVLALLLKRRVAGALQWYDMAIPLLVLTGRQWGLYADVINLSHGALPLVLILLIALAWLVANVYVRFAAISVLTFFATFTGFGYFAAVTVAGVYVVRSAVLLREGWRENRHELFAAGLCIVSCAVTMVLFFRNYVVEHPATGFVFPHPRPMEYLYFMGLELAYLMGARMPTLGREPGIGEIVYGMLLLALFTGFSIFILRRSLRKEAVNNRGWHVLLFLVLFTAAFLTSSAFGRVCTGLSNAMASRYAPLLMPGMLAVYLAVLQCPKPLRNLALGTILLMLTFATLRPPGWLATYYVDGKRAWIEAYRHTHEVIAADQNAQFRIFPDPEHYPIQERLDWMENGRLSIFAQ